MSSETESSTFIGQTHLACYLQYEEFVKSIIGSKEIDSHTTEVTELIWIDSIWELLKDVISEKRPIPHNMHKLTVLYKVNTYIKDNRY